MPLRIGLLCVQILVVIVFSLTPATVSADERTWTSVFTKQIKEWIQDLSTHDKEFSNWKQARTAVQALGPNSRQWLVTLTKQDKQVGYLVVAEEKPAKSERNPEFVLLEYGLGEYILFNDAIAPKHKGAQPVYDGFASFWKIDQNGLTQYIDAKTGEHYPSIFRPDNRIMDTLSKDELALRGLTLTKNSTLSQIETDPFASVDWLDAMPLNKQQNTPVAWEQLVQPSNKKTVVVTASLFQDEVFAPFTVGSIHIWGDKTAYIGVWDEGLRYLPSAYITRVGKIVQ